jgi:hypothetical protein
MDQELFMSMFALLQLDTRIGRAGPTVAYSGHIVFTTVAGQGWLAGQKPSLDAPGHIAREGPVINPANLIARGNFCFFQAAFAHSARRPIFSATFL